MGVEIRELVIRTSVGDANQATKGNQRIDRVDERNLINQCVAEVLKIIQREKER